MDAVQTFSADLRDAAAVREAVAHVRPDVVVHLAAMGTTAPFLDLETAVSHNFQGTANLVNACFQTNTPVKELIIARTPSERQLMNPYGISKAAVWQFCRLQAKKNGWPIHGAMIFQAYGDQQPAKTLVPTAIAAAQAGADLQAGGWSRKPINRPSSQSGGRRCGADCRCGTNSADDWMENGRFADRWLKKVDC